MSAAPSMAREETPRRVFPRHPINVPLDLIALRSGVPENLPGRCTDLSEAGVGAVVAGELAAGQQVAVELRLPNVGVPVRARALVRYQSRLHCGLEFVGLSVEQREMIRYWVYQSASQPVDSRDFKKEKKVADAKTEAPVVAVASAAKPRRRIRIGRRGFYVLVACMLALAGLGWWQWQKSWNELEKRAPARQSRLRVSPEAIERRIVTKVPFAASVRTRPAELTGRYSNFSACWKGTPRWSFEETIAETRGSPSSCQSSSFQSMFSAGSFHATVRSCSGA
jgi:hypothetical protein